MADRKINRVATSEIGVEANIEVKKIKRRKTKRKRPWIDFRRLWNEFRKSKSTYQPRVHIKVLFSKMAQWSLRGKLIQKVLVHTIFCFLMDFGHIWVLATKVI